MTVLIVLVFWMAAITIDAGKRIKRKKRNPAVSL